MSKENVSTAERNVIGMQEYSYRELMARLSPMQRSLAEYLAKNGPVKGLLSAETLKESGFRTAASIQSAYRGLEKAGLVSKTEGEVRLYDEFFATWLRNANS